MISVKKKSIILSMKATTRLTCLVGLLIFCKSDFVEAQTTTSGTFLVSFGVSDSCSISADTMAFAPYSGSQITATSAVSVDCTSGTDYAVSFNDAADGVTASTYKLVRDGTDGSATANYIEVSFTKSAGNTMTAGTASITGSGTGSSAAAGTITGSIAESQTGRTAGSFAKTMTLNIVY
jgi:spore coat protein U-like protein